MQSIATMNLRRIESHAERTRALKDAANRLVQRVLGCGQHDLSRPFRLRGRTYRVCVKCGMARDFNPENWKTLPQNHLVNLKKEKEDHEQYDYNKGLTPLLDAKKINPAQ